MKSKSQVVLKYSDNLRRNYNTDRSRNNNCFGADIYRTRDNHKENIPVGSLSTVFQAEVMAVLKSIEFLLSKNITRRIHICSDNRTAIAAPLNQFWYKRGWKC
jgi:hypothetical protein